MTRTVLRSTVRVIVVCAVALAVLLALAVAGGQLRTTTLLTGSMAPGLPAGSFLLERPVDAPDVRAGDVITFEAPDGGALVTHRVVATHQDDRGRWVASTRGDANDGVDDWQVVLSGGPVWTLRWHLTGIGSITTAVRDHQGPLRAAVVVLPLLLLASALRALWGDDATPEPDDGLDVLDSADELVGAAA